MSLLAGFDFIVEISNQAILKLIKSRVKIGGTPLNPPAEITIPLTANLGVQLDGTAFVVVTDLKLSLNADDTITLDMPFTRSAIGMTQPVSLMVDNLDGDLAVTAPLALIDLPQNQKSIALDLTQSSVNLSFSQASQNRIASGTGLPAAVVIGAATQAIGSFVKNLGSQQFPFHFTVVPNVDGSLAPLQVERLEIHSIADPNPDAQAIALFGILLASNNGQGDHTQKTATAISPGHDVAISISPGAFHSLVFCPGIRTQFGVQQGQSLPPSCGTAGGFDIHHPVDATIRDIRDTFAQDYISITGHLDKSGFCYEANASFEARIGLSVSGTGASAFLVQPITSSVNVDIPWYCWLLAAVIAGPLGLVIAGIGDAVAQSAADKIKGSVQTFADQLKNLQAQSVSAAGASFDTVQISPEGLTLNGVIPLNLPQPSLPTFAVYGSVALLASNVVSQGTFIDPSPCEMGAFPYTEQNQSQVGTYSAIYLGKPPVRISWWLSSLTSPNTRVPCVGNSGTAVVSGVSAEFPFPLPGGSNVTESIHIGYLISGGLIQLRNTPADGNFVITLGATATVLRLGPLSNFKEVGVEATTSVQFDGDTVTIGGGYYANLARCLHDLYSRLAQEVQLPNPIRWVPANYPPPDELIALIYNILTIGTPQAEQLLTLTKLAHQGSFLRAMSSPAALNVGAQSFGPVR